MDVYFRIKFQVSSVILTNCSEVGQFYDPTSKKAPKIPTHIRVNLV